MGGTSWLSGARERARAVLPAPVFEYVDRGSRESVSATEALTSWQQVRFAPHVLPGTAAADPDLGVEILGHRWEVPWGIAPTTLQRAVHPDGEIAMARATAAAGGVMVVSSNAGSHFADIAATGVTWWLQAYLPQDRSLAEPLLERAVTAGAEAVVLTLDTPVVATKYTSGPTVWDTVDPRSLRVNFDVGYDDHPGSAKARDLSTADLAWLTDRTRLPVVAKGVLRGDAAVRCVDAGASAVWVSNHGGRQLDRSITTRQALPEVREAIEGRADVVVDGGIGSGLDLLAALATGADAVFLGRLPVWCLIDGAEGVMQMNDELRSEVLEALRLAGVASPREARGIGRSGTHPI